MDTKRTGATDRKDSFFDISPQTPAGFLVITELFPFLCVNESPVRKERKREVVGPSAVRAKLAVMLSPDARENCLVQLIDGGYTFPFCGTTLLAVVSTTPQDARRGRIVLAGQAGSWVPFRWTPAAFLFVIE